jgi:hypothetical protein
MPRIDQQRRLYEAGRLRMGQKVGPKGRPESLAHWRLTSQHRTYLDAAQAVYGGTVAEWGDPKSDDRWELLTETASLDVFVHPQLPLSEWYELWAGYGCDRRCDGSTASLMDGRRGDVACACDPENRDCLPYTRLSVMLRGVEALGSWRLETKGRNAAAELGGAAELVHRATLTGWSLPCKLVIEQRTRRGKDADGKAVTRRFVVPVLTVDVTPDAAVAIAAGHAYTPPEVTAGATESAGLPRMPPRELGPPPKRTRRAIEDVIPAPDVVLPGDEHEPDSVVSDEGPPPFGEGSQDHDPGEARFHLSLAPSFRGTGEAQLRRHQLYAIAAGWGAGWHGLTGQAKNRVIRWSRMVDGGTHRIEQLNDERIVLVDVATGETFAYIDNDLKGEPRG